MSRALSLVKHAIAELAAGSEPVSFYDAHLLVRRVRQLRQDLDDELVSLLIQLHDAAHATDGARRVLGDLLRGAAKRRAHETDLAARPLFFDDAGKRVRVRVGAHVALHLDERREHGYRWEVRGPARGLRVIRSPESDAADVAILAVQVMHAGTTVLELEERRPPTLEPDPETPAATRRFALTIVGE